jgi:hypothetical protein
VILHVVAASVGTEHVAEVAVVYPVPVNTVAENPKIVLPLLAPLVSRLHVTLISEVPSPTGATSTVLTISGAPTGVPSTALEIGAAIGKMHKIKKGIMKRLITTQDHLLQR